MQAILFAFFAVDFLHVVDVLNMYAHYVVDM